MLKSSSRSHISVSTCITLGPVNLSSSTESSSLEHARSNQTSYTMMMVSTSIAIISKSDILNRLNDSVVQTIISRISVDVLQTVCCCGGRGDESSTWHQGMARLYTPVWCGRHWITCTAAQRLWHSVHQQKLNTQQTTLYLNSTV